MRMVALPSFARAKEMGMQCSYELPIAHRATVRRLLAEEAERYPEWEPTLESTREPEENFVEKKRIKARGSNHLSEPVCIGFNTLGNQAENAMPISPFGSPHANLEILNAPKK